MKTRQFAKNLNKNATANKKTPTTNYDPELPILIIFGNGLATGFCNEEFGFQPSRCFLWP